MIIFFPFVPIAAGHALKGLIALDLAGVMLKWRFLDHSAHLGGTLFGM